MRSFRGGWFWGRGWSKAERESACLRVMGKNRASGPPREPRTRPQLAQEGDGGCRSLGQANSDKGALLGLFLSFLRDFLFGEQTSAKGTSALFVRATGWKQPSRPSTGAWINSPWCAHKGTPLSNKKEGIIQVYNRTVGASIHPIV